LIFAINGHRDEHIEKRLGRNWQKLIRKLQGGEVER
jgi:hypothetical protein